MVAILVLLTIILFLTVEYIVQRHRSRALVTAPTLNPEMATGTEGVLPSFSFVEGLGQEPVPAGVFMGRNHQWYGLEPTGALKLGLDKFAVRVLGPFDEVRAVPAGTEVGPGDVVVSLRKGARSLFLRAPVAGRVEVNPLLAEGVERIASDPFGEGWLYRLSSSNLQGSVFANAKIGQAASDWIKQEIPRLRDFVAGLNLRPALAGVTHHDGGTPVAGLADQLSDEQWNQLRQEFFS